MIDRYGLFLALLCAVICLLPGCATTNTVPVEVKIPVPVLCQATEPEEPTITCYKQEQDIYSNTKCLLFERKTRIAYEKELQAALRSCK